MPPVLLCGVTCWRVKSPELGRGEVARDLGLAGLKQDRILERTKIDTQDSPSDVIVDTKS